MNRTVACQSGDPPWQGFPALAPEEASVVRVLDRCAALHVQVLRHSGLRCTRRKWPPCMVRDALFVSASIAQRMLSLAMYSNLSAEEQNLLLDRLGDAFHSV